MTLTRRLLFTRFIVSQCVLLGLATSLPADDQVYAPPSVDELKESVGGWLDRTHPDDADLATELAKQWEFESAAPSVATRFDALMRTFYLADEPTRALVDACLLTASIPTVDSFAVLETDDADSFLQHNVRYFYGRYLSVSQLYDEASEQLEQVDLNQVADPAGCLFYRAVCEHALLNKDACLSTIKTLLEDTEDVPLRYTAVARLMKEDIARLKPKSLGEVAKQMKDVERRLHLGESGERTQEVEEKIIATLDELIKKLEDQQQQQSGGGGGNGPARGNPSGNPAGDSYVGGQKGPGEVEKKNIGHKDNWGSMPPKAEAKAKNMINRQFPAHYRQAVEEYLKKIAEREAPTR